MLLRNESAARSVSSLSIRCKEALHVLRQMWHGVAGGPGFCPQCGKEVTQGMRIAYSQPNRVREHVRLSGHLVAGALGPQRGGRIDPACYREHPVSSSLAGDGSGRRSASLPAPFLSLLAVLILVRLSRDSCGMGIAATRIMGQGSHRGDCLSIAVQHSAGHCAGHLLSLGVVASGSDREYEEQVRAA